MKFKRNRAPASVWTNPIHFLAFGLGTGASPYAPGTVGTLLGIPLVYLLSQWPLWLYLVVTGFIVLLGTWVSDRTSKDIGVHDHGGIVIDEVAGFLVTMLAVPVNLWTVLIAFAAFRCFDIIKPWPIGWLDEKVHGGIGIMLDDLLAGVYGLLVIWLVIWIFPNLAQV
jgi:phosphatidylglycerophosphatase A